MREERYIDCMWEALLIHRDVESVAEARGLQIADALRRQGMNAT
jgi:hypothetical protein